MSKRVLSVLRPVGARRSGKCRRVSVGAGLAVAGLLVGLLVPVSVAGAQGSDKPGAPTGASATPSGDRAVTLRWSAPTETGGSSIIRYEYTYWESGEKNETVIGWTVIPGSSRTTTSYTVTGLKVGKEYGFGVRAVNAAGVDGESAEVTDVPKITSVPLIPRNLKAKAADSQITLTWTKVAAGNTDENDFNGYAPIRRYEYSQKIGDGDYSTWTTMLGSGSEFDNFINGEYNAYKEHVVTGLTNGVSYGFRVRAVNKNGPGAYSETSGTIVSGTPGRPNGLQAVPASKSVTLSWSMSSDGGSPITSWQYRKKGISRGSGFTAFNVTDRWFTIPGSDATTTSYVVTGLDNDKYYRFQVRAVNKNGVGTEAESADVHPGDVPGTPTDLTVTGKLGEDSVTLTWTPALADNGNVNDGGSSLSRYEYSLKAGTEEWSEWKAIPVTATSEGDTGANVSDTATDEQTYKVSKLTAGTAYLFRVRAVNPTGPGGHAETPKAHYPGTRPGAPTNVTVTPLYEPISGEGRLTISWVSGGDGGSPITGWQYKVVFKQQSQLASADWQSICSVTTMPTCASMTSVTLPRGGVHAGGIYPQGSITWPDSSVFGNNRWYSEDNLDYYVQIRAVNDFHDSEDSEATGGLSSSVVHARIEAHVPPAPTSVYMAGYIDDPDTIAGDTKAAVVLRAAIGTSETNRLPRTANEFSFRVGDGPWSVWHTPASGVSLTKPFDDLTNKKIGTSYTVRIRHVNKRGPGHPTEVEFVWGAPGMPGAFDFVTEGADTRQGPRLFVIPGTSQVTLKLQRWKSGSWQTVTTSGTNSTTVWEYSYRVDDGEWGEWTVVSQSEEFAGGSDDGHVVDGLENGRRYQFRIRGVNDADGTNPLYGQILESRGSAAVVLSKFIPPAIPGVAPPAPLGLSAAGGNGRVMLSWTSGGTGGPPITKWQYCSVPAAGGENSNDCNNDGSGWTDVVGSHAGTTRATIRPLINGTEYTYRVRAVNVFGGGAPAEALPVTPGRVPGAPVRALVEAGNSQVTIRVTKPAQNYGNRVVTYEVRKKRSGDVYDEWETLGTTVADDAPDDTRPSAESGAVVRNLVNGRSYTFQVRAKNGYGPGEHVETSAVVPVGPPSPGTLIATAGDARVVLSWSGTGSAGSTITGWQYRQREGDGGYGSWTDIADSTAATATHTVTGLSNGISHRFEVRAVTANRQVVGDEFESEAVVPSTVPPQPASVSATRGNTQVTLSWTAGTPGEVGESTWASETTGWQYRMKVGEDVFGAWTGIADSDAATTSHVVTGLANGVSHVFEVRAANAMGSGEAGSASATPATVPSAPTVSATAGDEMVTLSWTAGANGGSPITGWQSRTGDGEWVDVAGSDARTVPVQNLTNGVAYVFEVRAVNDVGAGASGDASATPATVPSAPELTATPGDEMVTLSWTATDDGGSPITGWHLRIDDGEWVDLTTMGLAADATGVPVPNLDNGVAHTFGVRAANAMGDGAAATESATPATVPPAPDVTVTAGDEQIDLAWTSTGNGGSPITGWQYRMRVGVGGFGEWITMGADATDTSLTGLDSGTGVVVYVFEVRAQNAVGAGAAATSDEVRPVEASMVGDDYYSGVVDSPNFCARFSLGGARLFALDADGDGVADTCSLPYTRREAIARQNAVVTLANVYPDEYRDLVNAACAEVEGDEPCGGEVLRAPGYAPTNDGGSYYSGVITGPGYCANASLGGPTTYPLDSDGDGVADTCSLPYSPREAIARQMAGDALAAMYLQQFNDELAEECRRRAGSDYGDDPADLANDVCATRA